MFVYIVDLMLYTVLKVSHANPDLENGTELEVKHVRRYTYHILTRHFSMNPVYLVALL